MQTYRNLSGTSGVLAYAIHDASIVLKFRNGERYLYSSISPGLEQVETMKRLANLGRGLSTFVSQVVKHRYETKLD